MNELNNALVELYGEDVYALLLEELNNLKIESNIVFDKKLTLIGLSFVLANVEKILRGDQEEMSLKTLVSKSFGEAAIVKYNTRYGSEWE